MSRLSAFRLPLLVLTYVVVAHTTIATKTIASVHIDLLLLLVVSVAVVGGREVGAVVGFVAGLIADAFLVTPFGLSALVFSFVGYLVGETERMGTERSWFVNALFIALASAAAQVLLSVGLYFIGSSDPFRHDFLIEVAVVTGVNFVLSPIALVLAKFAVAKPDADRPVSMRR